MIQYFFYFQKYFTKTYSVRNYILFLQKYVIYAFISNLCSKEMADSSDKCDCLTCHFILKYLILSD